MEKLNELNGFIGELGYNYVFINLNFLLIIMKIFMFILTK